MKPIEIYQGEDKAIVVNMNDDISAATEIEFRVDTSPQITKTLSASDITSVTATSFTVQINAADFATTPRGAYKYQARATIGGKKYNIRFTPNKFKILTSLFESTETPGDYGN